MSVEMLMNLKFPIPSEKDFAYRVFCWNLRLEKIFSFFHIDKDLIRCFPMT